MEVLVMQLLASCSLEESKKFNGKLVLPNEDKSKPDKVFLNIVVNEDSDASEVFQSLSGNEKCITFPKENPATFCPTSLQGRVFNECNLDDLNNGYQVGKVEGITTLVKLPEGYSDMRNLRVLCDMYPSIRFIGGKLLGVDGVRIGRFEEGKDKMTPVFDGIYDTFVEVNLSDLDGIQEIVRKTRKRAEGMMADSKHKRVKGKSGGSSKPKKTPKRLETFSKLFSSEEEEF